MKLLRRPAPMSPVARLSEYEQALLSIENVHCPQFVEDVGGLPLQTVHARLVQELSELPASQQSIHFSSERNHLEFGIETIGCMQKRLARFGIVHCLESPEVNP